MNCKNCCEEFAPNPRIKNQEYCSKAECQKARRRKWQREKLKNDIDYRQTQRESRKKWRAAHPDYQREYRKNNLEYVKRNRELQKIRVSKKRCKDVLDRHFFILKI